jgi:multicomponent Na+:H+ antiporter subunit D
MLTPDYLPFWAAVVPLIGAVIISFFNRRLPGKGNSATALCCLFILPLVLLMYPAVSRGRLLEVSFAMGFSLALSFRADQLGFLLGIISILLWTLVSFFAVGYMKEEHHQGRYNFFSLITLSGMLGVAFTGNLFSLYIFFEILSVASYVMVVHEQSKEAMRAGILYIFMGIIGGLILLFSIVTTYMIAGTGDFLLLGGKLAQSPYFPYIFWGYIIGFGIKAGIFPLHIWLPEAHPIAPSPASALLSGVMIKAGAYGIIRVLYSVLGPAFIRGNANIMVLFVISLITIFLGSAVAMRQVEIKKMLAYSSISQIGYIIMGATIVAPLGLVGGVIHIFNHALIKGTLFLCAGAFIHQVGLRQLKDLPGIGKRMPVTSLCFTVAALSMIGFPPFNGFISKWFLALGSLEAIKAGSYSLWVGILALGMLLLSSFMNLIYYGPIVYRAWFADAQDLLADDAPPNSDPPATMKWPMVLLTAGIIIFGIFPGWPLGLAYQVSSLFFR